MPPAGSDDFREYRRLILSELESLNKRVDLLFTKVEKNHTAIALDLGELKREIAVLKTKAAMWGGAIGGGVSLAVGLIIKALTG